MLWFIPTTHKVVIAGLLVIAAVAFVLFWVTWAAARRRARRSELELTAQAAIRHEVRTPEPPHGTPQAPFPGDPEIPPPQAPHDE